jgi:hypothetical protein
MSAMRSRISARTRQTRLASIPTGGCQRSATPSPRIACSRPRQPLKRHYLSGSGETAATLSGRSRDWKPHTNRTRTAPMHRRRAKLGLSPRLPLGWIARDCVGVPSTTRTASNRHGEAAERDIGSPPRFPRWDVSGETTHACRTVGLHLEAMFVDIETDRGVLQFVAYNAHNGYYGHKARVQSTQLRHTVTL